MVQCGRCHEWYHFSCVGVDESVAELAWFCSTCLGEDVSTRESLGQPGISRIQPPRGVKKTGSSNAGKSNEKVNKKNVEKPSGKNITKDVIWRSVDQEKNKKQTECQAGTSQLNVGGNAGKALSKKSARSHASSVGGVGSHRDGRRSAVNSQKSGSGTSKSSKRDLALRQMEEIKEKSRLDTLEEENQMKMLELKQKQIERQKRELAELQQLSRLVEEESESEEEVEQEVAIAIDYREKVQGWMKGCEQGPQCAKKAASVDKDAASSNFSLVLPETIDERERRMHLQKRSSSMVEAPTKLQIASRQVFPKCLPDFSGQPQDWPLFISAYEQANLSCGFNNAENLVRLQGALKGKALEIVRHRLMLPDNVPTIIEKLRRRFGNPEILSTMLAQRIQRLEGPDSESLESVIEFGSAIEEFTQHLEVAKLTDHLKNPILMQSLVQKLPSCYAMQWVEYKRRSKVVDLKTFGKFMEDLVDKALEVTFERMEVGTAKKRERSKSKVFVHSTDKDCEASSSNSGQQYQQTSDEPSKFDYSSRARVQISPKRDISCSICEKLGHFGRECREFQNMSLSDRWKIVKRLELCALCLYNHGKWSCRSKIRCDIEGCKEPHHHLLHRTTGDRTTSKLEARCNSHRSFKGTVLFRILPVKLYNGEKEVDTLALVDEGSSVTLVDGEVAEQLEADGPLEPLKMCWTNGVSRTEKQSKKLRLEISDKERDDRFELIAARTVASV